MTAELNPATYWKDPLLPPKREDWVDPDPDTRGMLSADRIQFYVDKVRLIDPFNVENLKPASYALSLGPSYQHEGTLHQLTSLQPTLVIPENSIVFVAMRESLRLPHYMAARFNLAIEHIYKGLLLGTGPQVDPGFQGVLSCPLHNISNQPIRIDLGEHLATIDFIKTTGIHEGKKELLESSKDEDELYSRREEIQGFAGYPNQFFKREKRWVRPILAYPAGDRKVASSVHDLEEDIKEFRKIGLIGAAGLLLSLVLAIGPLFVDVQNDLQDARNETATLENQVTELRGQISRLERIIEDAVSRRSRSRD